MTLIDKSNQPITTDYDAQTTAWQLKKKNHWFQPPKYACLLDVLVFRVSHLSTFVFENDEQWEYLTSGFTKWPCALFSIFNLSRQTNVRWLKSENTEPKLLRNDIRDYPTQKKKY